LIWIKGSNRQTLVKCGCSRIWAHPAPVAG
jgi:hypothetical protein